MSVLIFSTCYEPTNGCLDIRASNYSIDADDPCEDDCCQFPSLSLTVCTVYDTSSFLRNTNYITDLGDTILVDQMYLILSDFILAGRLENYEVIDSFDYNADGTYERNDPIVVQLVGNTTTRIGDIVVRDSLESWEVRIGLQSEIDDASNSFSANEDLQELVDSLYINSDNAFEFFRVEFSTIAQDTVQYTSAVSGQVNMFDKTFITSQGINYGSNVVLTMQMDVKELFDGINFATIDSTALSERFANNLNESLFIK